MGYTRAQGLWVLTHWNYVRGVRVCFDLLKCHILSFKTAVGQLYKFHIIKDGRLVTKMEGWGAWNSLMAWPDWWRSPLILRQIYSIARARTYTDTERERERGCPHDKSTANQVKSTELDTEILNPSPHQRTRWSTAHWHIVDASMCRRGSRFQYNAPMLGSSTSPTHQGAASACRITSPRLSRVGSQVVNIDSVMNYQNESFLRSRRYVYRMSIRQRDLLIEIYQRF